MMNPVTIKYLEIKPHQSFKRRSKDRGNLKNKFIQLNRMKIANFPKREEPSKLKQPKKLNNLMKWA